MEDIKSMLGELKLSMDSNNTNLNNKLDKIQESVTPLQTQVTALIVKVERLDKNDRRRNLILHGIPNTGRGQEFPTDLENSIIHLFHHQLQIKDFSKPELDFVRRIGATKDGNASTSTPRPVIVGLTTERRKFEILRNSNRLKDTQIYIHPDLTDKAREEKKQLVIQMREERAKGNYVVIRQNKLVLGDEKQNKNKRALSESPETAVDKNTNKRLFQSNLTEFLSNNTSSTTYSKNE